MNKWKLLVVEDDDCLREALSETLTLSNYQVISTACPEEALNLLSADNIDLVISDIQMPKMTGCELLKKIKDTCFDLPVVLITAYGTIKQAVDAIRSGASEYLVKPFEAESLLDIVARNLPNENVGNVGSVIRDPKSDKLYELAKKVARSNVSVLINGESGAGKEVLARFIHENSPRHNQPFIAINCAAIPENMLEAVLFGYEKGAFTGAHQRNAGKFELAQGGTLLLDEISEMDLALQAKLLRVLQEKEVERLGGRSVIKLDVRVLATTNKDLRQEVKSANFREDLFYRLNVFPLSVLPLRERLHDILPIAEEMIKRHFYKSNQYNMSEPIIGTEAKQKLLAHQWGGNVRELENVIQRALVVYQGAEIKAEDIVIENMAKPSIETLLAADEMNPLLAVDLKKHEQELILQALTQGNGSRKYAAETLGISPRTLRYKISKMREQGISIPPAYGVA